MKIVIIIGSGPLGRRLVTALRAAGQDVAAAAPGACFNALTGEGLPAVLNGADVVVDLSEPPRFADPAVVEPFATATRALLEHEVVAGVTHHVALAPLHPEHLSESGYFRARLAKEQLIRHGSIPYTIVRATPLFETLAAIADAATHGGVVRVPPVLVQPVAADDVIRLLAGLVVGAPLDGTIEIGGPEPFYLNAIVERLLGATNDPRTVIGDPHALLLGAQLDPRSLVAADEAELGALRFDDWLRETGRGAERIERAALDAYEFRVSDVPPGAVLLMGDVAVFSAAGGLCATQAACPHRGGPLSEGSVDDNTVTCPLHGAQFNIWTGAVLRGPATTPLKTYAVVVDDGIGRVIVERDTAVAR